MSTRLAIVFGILAGNIVLTLFLLAHGDKDASVFVATTIATVASLVPLLTERRSPPCANDDKP
jgi:hypothetical protein